MRLPTSITLLLILLFTVSSAQAQYVQAYKIDNAAKERPEDRVFSEIAGTLGIGVETLGQVRAESGLSMGQVYIAYSFAKALNVDVRKLLAETKTKSWGTIAEENKINIKQISRDVEKLEAIIKKLPKKK